MSRYDTRIRRGQMISPFGPGALYTTAKGVTVAISSIDAWDTEGALTDVVNDPRLALRLNVDELRQPPTQHTVPVYRFPQWHVCTFAACGAMRRVPLSSAGVVRCEVCAEGKTYKREMRQVRFVMACEDGHLSDFPWMEWVHRSERPTCRGPLRYSSSGGDLSTVRVTCTACKMKRSLEQVTRAYSTDETYLSQRLQEGDPYTCPGHMPWMGSDGASPEGLPLGTGCQKHVRASLINATNLYFPDVVSSVYIPDASGDPLAGVTRLVREGRQHRPLRRLVERGDVADAVIDARDIFPVELRGASDEDVARCLRRALDPEPELPSMTETAYRRHEYRVLSEARTDPDLVVRPVDPEGVWPGAVHLVERLRESRALVTFSRFGGTGGTSALLKRPGDAAPTWLPATEVFGEGLFLRLDETLVQSWEARADVQGRYSALTLRSRQAMRRPSDPEATPRFVLLHTLAHLLINRLVFECGYSTASLRERLYVSDDAEEPMAGLLLYTATGDADGTLGGLVRMGEPARLGPVLARALEGAQWCGSDPVCMEAGGEGGQGPDGCNLAACHACSLLPETSCEHGNRYLDRAALVGTPEAPDSGFFSAWMAPEEED